MATREYPPCARSGRAAARAEASPARSGRRGWLNLVDTRANGVLLARVPVAPPLVELSELLPLGWDGALVEDGIHWALGLTRATLDALVRVDLELAIDIV